MEVLAKHMVSVVQDVSRSFEPWPIPRWKQVEDVSTRNEKLVSSNLKTLKGLKKHIARIVTLYISCPYVMHSTRYGDEHLKRYFNSLLQNLKDISIISKSQRIISQWEKLAVVEERLKYLKTFLCLIFVPFKPGNFVAIAEELAVEISYTLFLCFVDDEFVAHEHTMDYILPDLLRKFNSLLLQLKEVSGGGSSAIRLADDHVLGFVDFLISKLVLLSTKSRFTDEVKVQLQTLADELRFIRSSLMDMLLQNPIQGLESLNISIATLIVDTGFFVYFCPDKTEDEELIMTNYWSLGLHDSLETVQNVQQQAADLFKKYLPLSLQSNCPSSNELEFVDFLINKLKEVMLSGEASIYPLKHQMEMVNEEMVTLRNCLSGVAGLMGNSQIGFLLTRFKHAAYQAKYVLNSLMAGEGSLWLHKLGSFVITNDIKILQKEVKTTWKMNLDSGVHSVSKASTHASTQIHQPPSINVPGCSKDGMQIKIEEDANKLVGRKDAVAEIVGLLTEGSSHLKILSIVGMPGLGKTTLANAVCKHPFVDTCFEVRAWGSLSQVYQKETLLSSIVDQVHANPSHDISGEDVGQMLYQSLKRRRYLIVLDNIWDIETWSGLCSIFPDDKNGSRILFTTRSHGVAAQANSFPYALRLLSSEESCELLWLKLFNGETCPRELSSISKRIACSCKGLPLAVVLIAGALNRTKKEKKSWEKVARTFIRSRSIQEQIWDILDGSYKLLPDHLKPCFWYLGTFPRGTTISVSKLIRLWISEGFIHQPNSGQKSLIQEAESYLNDLIDRSLVLVTRKSSKGGVKECRVHDVLREFCSAILKQERYEMQEHIFPGGISVLYGDFRRPEQNLLSIFPTTKEPQISSLMYYDMTDIEKESGDREDLPKQKELRDLPPRIGDTSLRKRVIFTDLSPIGRVYLTEQVPATGGGITRQGRLHYGSVHKYKYLRVLDLANVLFRNSADTSDLVKIAELVYLRYLAIKIRTNRIPSEIGNLRNLETFHLSGAIGRVTLPEAVWKLVCLRDVIMDHCFFSFQHCSQEFFEDSTQLDNLKSLSTIYIWHGNVEKLARMLPSVQKLGCIFSNSWQECCEASNPFKILECLRELQSLKMSFHVRAPYPFKFTFPSNLKKLTISNARLPWDEISVIGQLPNLEVLKLLSKAFEGQQWDMREGEFQKLKFLKLDSLDIVQWSASGEHLPCLEQLVVLSCQQLEEIPSCFGEISTLQLIELKWCSASAKDSVKQILDDQRDYGNHQLNVTVVGSQCGIP
ncbi:putative late blight resistance protein homolog R1B-14 [Coffea eugenioides]|uniref:putative late blight resistance protein homolog R1B-14 n=1 Tax=Coffea eugenioides TaxID=49369 RepID=UPI000F606F80|nr:putative late blight resistance protein homolog R1B-14 [Coffea eugenioides]XP_027155166.1 putative late blight resistance protein homolog R1B-14 [Coffea eugenioides]